MGLAPGHLLTRFADQALRSCSTRSMRRVASNDTSAARRFSRVVDRQARTWARPGATRIPCVPTLPRDRKVIARARCGLITDLIACIGHASRAGYDDSM